MRTPVGGPVVLIASREDAQAAGSQSVQEQHRIEGTGNADWDEKFSVAAVLCNRLGRLPIAAELVAHCRGWTCKPDRWFFDQKLRMKKVLSDDEATSKYRFVPRMLKFLELPGMVEELGITIEEVVQKFGQYLHSAPLAARPPQRQRTRSDAPAHRAQPRRSARPVSLALSESIADTEWDSATTESSDAEPEDEPVGDVQFVDLHDELREQTPAPVVKTPAPAENSDSDVEWLARGSNERKPRAGARSAQPNGSEALVAATPVPPTTPVQQAMFAPRRNLSSAPVFDNDEPPQARIQEARARTQQRVSEAPRPGQVRASRGVAAPGAPQSDSAICAAIAQQLCVPSPSAGSGAVSGSAAQPEFSMEEPLPQAVLPGAALRSPHHHLQTAPSPLHGLVVLQEQGQEQGPRPEPTPAAWPRRLASAVAAAPPSSAGVGAEAGTLAPPTSKRRRVDPCAELAKLAHGCDPALKRLRLSLMAGAGALEGAAAQGGPSQPPGPVPVEQRRGRSSSETSEGVYNGKVATAAAAASGAVVPSPASKRRIEHVAAMLEAGPPSNLSPVPKVLAAAPKRRAGPSSLRPRSPAAGSDRSADRRAAAAKPAEPRRKRVQPRQIIPTSSDEDGSEDCLAQVRNVDSGAHPSTLPPVATVPDRNGPRLREAENRAAAAINTHALGALLDAPGGGACMVASGTGTEETLSDSDTVPFEQPRPAAAATEALPWRAPLLEPRNSDAATAAPGFALVPLEGVESRKLTRELAASLLDWDSQRLRRAFDLFRLQQRQAMDDTDPELNFRTALDERGRIYKNSLDDVILLFNLKRKIEGSEGVRDCALRALTTRCHQCAHHTVWHPCDCSAEVCGPAHACGSDGDAGLKRQSSRPLCGSKRRPFRDGTVPPCQNAFCPDCLDEFYGGLGLSKEELQRRCPVCRGLCNCRAALLSTTRHCPTGPPDLTDEEQQATARLALSLITPALVSRMDAWRAEAQLDRFEHLHDVPVHEADGGRERCFCDRCRSSISGVARCCPSCHVELCTTCCQELRAAGASSPLRCPKPDCRDHPPLQLKAFISPQRMQVLEAVADRREELQQPSLRAYAGTAHLVGHLPTRAGTLRFAEEERAEPSSTSLLVTSHEKEASGSLQVAGNEALLQDLHDATPAMLAGILERHLAGWRPSGWQPTVPEVEQFLLQGVVPAHYSSVNADHCAASDIEWGAHLRLSAWTHEHHSGDNYLLCVEAADLEPQGAETSDARQAQAQALQAAFYKDWSQGKPVIVCGVKGHYSWDPTTLSRGMQQSSGRVADTRLDVINCNTWHPERMSSDTFFAAYRAGAGRSGALLKLKDYPPGAAFADALIRHNQDFLNMLPMQHLTRVDDGALNLATKLDAQFCLPTDLGPKGYIALGRERESIRGDSFTATHLDMSDAVNVMLHQQYVNASRQPGRTRRIEPWKLPAYGGAGAIWDIWRREDLPALRHFMRNFKHLFPRHGDTTGPRGVRLAEWEDPVHSAQFAWSNELRLLLLRLYGVQGWHFEQHPHEAVFIPAGCAHQVRNLDSSIKIAVDFVSPHNMELCLHMAQEMRTRRDPRSPLAEVYQHSEMTADEAEKLQAEVILVHSAQRLSQELGIGIEG